MFMRWSNCHDRDRASVALVIFSASPELTDRLGRLWAAEISGVLVDPWSLFVICLDELWLESQSTVANVQHVFGQMERVG